MDEPFRIVLPKPVPCKQDWNDDPCTNLTFYGYLGNDGIRYPLCTPCLLAWARRHGAVSLVELLAPSQT